MPAPESFQTARLEGARLTAAHLEDLRVLHRDPETMRELGGVRGEEETAHYLRRNLDHWATHGFGVWMLCEKGSERSIGRVLLRGLSTATLDAVEIGFAFLPTHWGRGLATEAATFCLDVARRDLGLQTLIGITTPQNLASQRVLTKLGFSYECDTTVESTDCYLFRARW